MLLIMLKRVRSGYFLETREGLLGRSEEFACADRETAEGLVSGWFDQCDLGEGEPDVEVKLPAKVRKKLIKKGGYYLKCRTCGANLSGPKRWTRAQCRTCKKLGRKIPKQERRKR